MVADECLGLAWYKLIFQCHSLIFTWFWFELGRALKEKMMNFLLYG